MLRRSFLKGLGAFGLTTGADPRAALRTLEPAPDGADDRAYWISTLTRIVEPVVANLAKGQLRARMPVEQKQGADRASVTRHAA